MFAQGLSSVVDDLFGQAARIDDDAEEALEEASDRGVDLAKERVRRLSGDTAESIGAERYETGQGPAVLWGPTTEAGRHLENGTSTMGPFPYLGPSLDPAADLVEDDLGRHAADL